MAGQSEIKRYGNGGNNVSDFKVTQLKSKNDMVSKFVLEKENDIIVEAVLYKYPDFKTRTVLCISVQCGCPIGCTFCGTGKKFIRNLTADEIIEQVEIALSHIDCKPKNIGKFQIMFMSMGEPFCNYENVKEAIIALSHIYKNAQLLVSTVAPSKMARHLKDFIKLSKRIPAIGLQFSLHETTDKEREKIIPKSIWLEMIAMIGESWAMATNRKPYFNYCVKETNNKTKNINQLLKLFDPAVWEATLSVLCSTWNDDQGEQEKQLPMVKKFADKMTQKGYSTRVFNPISEYGSGCGMLHHFQYWLKSKI